VSPPARGRGLKPKKDAGELQIIGVAPRTGAWIETNNLKRAVFVFPVAPPHGGVD